MQIGLAEILTSINNPIMALYYKPIASPLGAIAKAAVMGAYFGTAIELATIALIEFRSGEELWADFWSVPLLILAYGTLAIPFTALGLCCFGLPLGRLLRPLLSYRWSAVIAAIAGALCGQVFWWLFAGLLWGRVTQSSFWDAAIGAAWGLPTGFAYWFFERRSRLALFY